MQYDVSRLRHLRKVAVLFSLGASLVACSSGSNTGQSSTGSGGQSGGVTGSAGGSGGASKSGGASGTAGSTGAGGMTASGGQPGSGGSGGSVGTGGSSTGGSVGTGGSSTGGNLGAGGSSSGGSGGATASGGKIGSGGTGGGGSGGTASGGAAGAGSGGRGGSGGTASGGAGGRGGSGGSASGGATGSGGSASGGATGSGGSASGGATGSGGSTGSCGSTTTNSTPFGCGFAWGLQNPGGSLSAYSYLQFMTQWVESGVAADGSFSSCTGCSWLSSYVASTSLVPVYYAYMIGFLGHANGLVDGNQCSGSSCSTLANQGAALIKSKRSAIIQLYANYAKQTYAVWSSKPLVWLLEGDFIQYTDSGQSSPLTMAELAQLAADITCAIKSNMPNAVVAIDHTNWNTNDATNQFWNAMKTAQVNYDMVWTTGVANNNGFITTGTSSSSYNGATATYAYVHQLTGKTIFVDDGCGGSTNEDWTTSSASVLNARIASGVVAFGHCASPTISNYQSAISSLSSQLSSTCQ